MKARMPAGKKKRGRRAERIEFERAEAERAEAERVEAERVEAERIEAERVEAERIEAERVEAERIEAERVEAERVKAERIAQAEHLTLASVTPKKLALVRGVEDSLECAICQTVVVAPVVTPCGHLFCGDCIVTSLRVAGENCPSCRDPMCQEQLIPVPFISTLIERLSVTSPGIRRRNSLDRREAESAARPLVPSDSFRVGDVVAMSRYDDESDESYQSLGRVEAVRLIKIAPYHEYDVRFEDGSMETTFSEDDVKRPDEATVADDDDINDDNPSEARPTVEDEENDATEHKADEENLAMGLALSLSMASE